ncbi:GNAT family N-acetyltransferase [Butyrivibrio sp. AE3009]|uniref:GNAT family N-acetyltransferase n=1 Tax=Butyrivibrio sp. AE3009 TaxID=1280666 RepID=UPI0003B5825A|nr:GNAT family N-acetyltransferase [Butyrivibrio sp. AE3009]
MHRLYENEDIAVFWNSDKCRHAKQCVNGSPRTFNAARRPWIDVTKAPTAEIWQAISACPSGAVTCIYTHGIRIEYEKDESRSAAYDGDLLIGECDYRKTPDGWNIYHTEVNPEYGGKGIAKRLVYKVIEAAEQCGNTVVATCSYADKVLKE